MESSAACMGFYPVLSHFVVYISSLLCIRTSLGTSEECISHKAACELGLSAMWLLEIKLRFSGW